MSSESAPKPRFVLCPKCRLLLQEPPNFDVYKCGGCSTTLQAKKRKNRAANSESSSHVTDAAAPRNASDLVSDDKQYNNGEMLVSPQKNVSREISTNSLSVDSSLEGNEGRNRIENSECNGEQPSTIQENGSSEKATFSSSGECSLEENIARGLIENGKCNEEQTTISQKNALRETRASSSSGECSLDENGERGQIEKGECNEEQPVISQENDLREKATSSSEECSLDGNSGRVQIENGKCDEEQLVPFNLSDEEPEDEVDIYKLSDTRRHSVSNKGYLNELPQASAKLMVDNSAEKANVTNLKLEKEQSNGTNKVVSKELNSGNLLLQRTEEDIGGNASTNERLSTENFASEKGNISYVSRRELKEGTSDHHASSPENVRHSFDDLRSVDTFDNTEVNNLSLEIIGALGKLSKSPTTRSSHAYDGSVSSNDGMDERFLGQNLYSFEGGSRKGKGVDNSMLYEDVEMQHKSTFPDRKYQNEGLETTRHDHAHRMRTKQDEFPFPFKMPLHGSGTQSGYESGSPLNQIYDELYCSSSYVSPDCVEDPDQEKMKLLRMVYKLQDQLNRTSHENRETNERPPVVNHVSAYQSPDFHERRFNHGLDYPRGNANPSYSHDINWNQRQRNFSRIPYSTEPTSSSQHVDHPCLNCHPQERQRMGEFPQPVDHPCLNCYPQERQRSGEFPPHFPYPREDLYRPHPSHTRCLSHKYYPSSSPQWLINSKHVHGRETKSCDQRHRAPEMNYTRDKPILNKRHYRPVAGGAPFVTCHNCLKLVQLPADFLIFKRVCHKLKCGACQEVLKFSLQNRSHIVSYVPNAVEPSSSDLDIQNKPINGVNSHAADPVSYSDDYDHSLSKSHSSEGEPVSVASLHHSHDSARNNPTVSPSTVEAIREEKIVSRGPSTSKAASNVSSEREAPQKPSALHQLMGYTSPSQVIRGSPYSDEGKDTSPSQVARGAPYSDEGKEVMKYIFGGGIIN